MCQVHCCTVFENQLYYIYCLVDCNYILSVDLISLSQMKEPQEIKGDSCPAKECKATILSPIQFDTGNGHLISGKRMQSYNSFTSVSVTLASHANYHLVTFSESSESRRVHCEHPGGVQYDRPTPLWSLDVYFP